MQIQENSDQFFRSQEELLVHTLIEILPRFFKDLQNTTENPAHKLYKQFLIPIEIILIATLYPGHLKGCKLRVIEGRIRSDVLEQINTRLLNHGYLAIENDKIQVLPVREDEKHLFPRIINDVPYRFLLLLFSGLNQYNELEFIHPTITTSTEERINKQVKQFDYLIGCFLLISITYTHNYQRKNIKGPAILDWNKHTQNELITYIEKLTAHLEDFFDDDFMLKLMKKYFLAVPLIMQQIHRTETKFEKPRVISDQDLELHLTENVYNLLNS